jgi:hypothetical protein
MMFLNALKSLDPDRFLNMVGVQTRRSMASTAFPAAGLFAAGVLVGAGIALLLAPTGGDELRGNLARRLHLGGSAQPQLTDNRSGRSNSRSGEGTRSTRSSHQLPRA